jgi:hypothetical protein
MEIENLDLDWLEVQKRLSSNIDGKCVKENMNSINIHYIFVDSKSNISSIVTEKEELSNVENDSIISRERILELIQSKKNFRDVKYKLSELLKYNVNLEPNNVQSYNNDVSLNFLEPVIFVDCIKIPPTLFIFHQINCLFIIYNEIPNSHLVNKTKKKLSLRPSFSFTQKIKSKKMT